MKKLITYSVISLIITGCVFLFIDKAGGFAEKTEIKEEIINVEIILFEYKEKKSPFLLRWLGF